MKSIKKFTSYPYMTQDDLNQEVFDACYRGNLEQLKYALHSPELKIHGDIYYDKGECFIWAYIEKHMDIVNYLLYEEQYQCQNLKKISDSEFSSNTPSLPLREINDLFEKRDLYFKLNDIPLKKNTKPRKI